MKQNIKIALLASTLIVTTTNLSATHQDNEQDPNQEKHALAPMYQQTALQNLNNNQAPIPPNPMQAAQFCLQNMRLTAQIGLTDIDDATRLLLKQLRLIAQMRADLDDEESSG